MYFFQDGFQSNDVNEAKEKRIPSSLPGTLNLMVSRAGFEPATR
jgi:hypothetical protein